MLSREASMPTVYFSILLLIHAVLAADTEAQAPEKPTIAVSSDSGGNNAIWYIDPDGGDPRSILKIEGAPLSWGMEWSPDGSQLAFHTQVGKNVDVYVMSGDGEKLKRLTDQEGEDSWPTWHPSGRRLAFASDRDGNLEIQVMNLVGKVLENLTNDPAPDTQPTWSPDGRQIAFATKRGKSLGDIWAMEANGDEPRNLTNTRGKEIQPKWSPDGKWIVWSSQRNGNGDIFVMDPQGENLRQISGVRKDAIGQWDDREVSWSPDSKRVVYISRSPIFIAEVDKDDELVAHPMLPDIGVIHGSPAWFDPDFVRAFSVSPVEKRPLAWGWLKQLRRGN